MVAESKKSGNCYYFEPLHHELNDTFGAMKNVTPDSVFSNLKGLQINPNSDKSNTEEDNEDEEPQLVAPSTSNSGEDVKKKTSKSMEELISLKYQQFVNNDKYSCLNNFSVLTYTRIIVRLSTCGPTVQSLF